MPHSRAPERSGADAIPHPSGRPATWPRRATVEPESDQPLRLLADPKVASRLPWLKVGDRENLLCTDRDKVRPDPVDDRINLTEDHLVIGVPHCVAGRPGERLDDRGVERARVVLPRVAPLAPVE